MLRGGAASGEKSREAAARSEVGLEFDASSSECSEARDATDDEVV
mgnify:CR=1 FL=1